MNIYNFSAGPAMLPKVVMEEVRETFLNYRNTGASIIEIGHRSDIFVEVLEETQRLFYQLTDLPANYKILFVHGGARMQFSAIPLNLREVRQAAETSAINRALALSDGNISQAAKLLGITRPTLYDLMSKYGMDTGLSGVIAPE